MLRIPIPRDDGSLTPYTFVLGYPLVTLVYDTLTTRGGGGLARTIHRSNGGRRITIRLQEGVRWHDGKPLTARDVAFTFTYVKHHFHPRFTPQLEAVVGARALSDRTVAITLRHPSPGFNSLPLSDLPILPRHLWKRLPAGRLAPAGLPVGSGPYRLVEHRKGKRYRFRANRGYFLGRPRVDRIDVPFINDYERTIRELRNRRLDMIPVTLTSRTQGDLRQSVFKTKLGTLYTGTVLMFNVRKPPFDDPQARRAIADALDIRRIARSELVGGQNAVPADTGYLHPASGWATSTPLYRFRPARARAALARLHLGSIRILAPDNDPAKLEAARQVVLSLERAGARAVVRKVSAKRLASAVGEDGSAASFDAAIWSSPALASYEPDFMRVVFGSKQAPLNYSGYRSASFDAYAKTAASATNPETRVQSVRSEITLLASDLPVIPLFFQQGAFVYRPQIYDGWVYAQGAGIFDKRSFLPRVVRPVGGPAPQPAPAASTQTGGATGGLGPAGYIALGLAGIVAIVIAVGYAARLRSR